MSRVHTIQIRERDEEIQRQQAEIAELKAKLKLADAIINKRVDDEKRGES